MVGSSSPGLAGTSLIWVMRTMQPDYSKVAGDATHTFAQDRVAVHPMAGRRAARAAVVALCERLDGAARVTVVSAPPGSGKTVLLRSWIADAGLAGRVAWVPVGQDERDPQRFWLSVLDALRQTSAGSALVRALTAAPDLDGWTIVERLLKDLAPLAERLWLVIDDLQELGSAAAPRPRARPARPVRTPPPAGVTRTCFHHRGSLLPSWGKF